MLLTFFMVALFVIFILASILVVIYYSEEDLKKSEKKLSSAIDKHINKIEVVIALLKEQQKITNKIRAELGLPELVDDSVAVTRNDNITIGD